MEIAPDVPFSNLAADVRAAEGYAYLAWRPGVRHLPDFQQALEVLLVLLRRQGTGKALIDQRAMAPLSAAEHGWVLTHWLPRAAAQGHYRYAAVLPPHNTQARDATMAVRTAHLPAAPLYVDFPDEEQARAWLRRQIVIHSSI